MALPELRHEQCKCGNDDRFRGKWGTPEAMQLFGGFWRLQNEGGEASIERVWQMVINGLMADGAYERPGELEQVQSDKRSELPLGMILSEFVYDDRNHWASGYGLVRVDPVNGQVYEDAWADAVFLTETDEIAEPDDYGHDFTAEQKLLFAAQVRAQEAAGLMLRVASLTRRPEQ